MIQHWLKPLKKEFIEPLLSKNMAQFIDFHYESFPVLRDGTVAIIGFSEDYDEVRKELYQNLQWHFGQMSVVDLGYLKKTEEMYLQPILQELIEGNIFPILLGMPIFLQNVVDRLLISKFKKFNFANISSRIDSVPKPNIHYLPIGYQQHYIHSAQFEQLDNLFRDHLRLGQFRANNEDAEVLLRSSILVNFDISCIRASDAIGQQMPSPNGVTSEEWCLLNRFAGISDATKIISITGYDFSLDNQFVTARLIAQGLWYLLEGIYERMGDYPSSLNNLVEYVVDIQSLDQYSIVFWKSTKSGRWWMEIEKSNLKLKQNKLLIPCSIQDYLKASNNEIPDRLIKAISYMDEY